MSIFHHSPSPFSGKLMDLFNLYNFYFNLMLSFLFKGQNSFEVNLNEYLASTSRLDTVKLHNVMTALRGQDPTIKSEIAFATLKKLLTAFQPDNSQLRILKELIVLDQLVQENIFCVQISLTNFFSIENARGGGGSASKENVHRVLRLFWKIIKDKGIIMVQGQHIFHEKRSQRDLYLSKLKPFAILGEIGSIEIFFITTFELVYCLQHPNYVEERETVQWKKSGTMDHIILHLLYKLFYLYNCQMMIHRYLLSVIEQLTQQELLKLKRYIIKFRDHCNKFINFVKEHHAVRGFENANFEEIRVEVNEVVTKFIDDYLHHLQVEANGPYLAKQPINMGKMTVQKKPLNEMGKLHQTPRLLCPQLKKQHSNTNHDNNVFLNWQNSYSHQFPQKEIMSVDLIMQIKLEQSLQRQSQQQQVNQQRDDKIYLSYFADNRSTCASSGYGVNFMKIKQYFIPKMQVLEFQNIYSRTALRWNE